MSEKNQEPTVTMETLDASLDDLLKATDASDLKEKLSKAYGGTKVQTGQHMDENGVSSGSLATDVGGIDKMMIAKLKEGGFTEAQITAFMRGKLEDEEEDDDEDEEEDYDKSEVPSFRKSFDADSDIQDGIDASPFMEGLTERTIYSLDKINKSMSKSFAKQSTVNKAIASTLYVQGQELMKAMSTIHELRRRLGIVEQQPMPRRGARSEVEAKQLAKSMPGEAGHPGGGERLVKSKVEAVNALNYMSIKKGLKQVGGEQTSRVVSRLESTDQISDAAMKDLESFLQTHPNEAEAAKAFA